MATARRTRKAAEPATDPGQLLDFYHDMLLIRRFEEKAGQLYGMGLINGFCHLYIGQEAVVEDDDLIVAAHIEHDPRPFLKHIGIQSIRPQLPYPMLEPIVFRQQEGEVLLGLHHFLLDAPPGK